MPAALRALSEALITTANAIVVALDNTGTIVEFNPAAETITGYSRAELAGRNWFEVICPRERYPEVWDEFERLSSGGMPRSFANPILTKSGDERYIVWSTGKWRTEGGAAGSISFGIDMTEQRAGDRTRAETAALLGSIIEGAPSAIFAKDLDGKYVLINSTAAMLLGKPREEILGKDDSQLFPEQAAHVFKDGDRRVIETGESFAYEEEPRGGVGPWQNRLSAKGPTRDEEGRLVGVFGVTTDITVTKAAEAALSKAARENEQLAKRRWR